MTEIVGAPNPGIYDWRLSPYTIDLAIALAARLEATLVYASLTDYVQHAAAPERAGLTDEFVRNYYRYADQLFLSRQGQVAFTGIEDLGFEFEIYASGEYSKMLEREWAEK